MQKAKVLFVVECMAGGVFTYVVNLTNRLADRYEVCVAHGIRDHTPENYREYFDERIRLVHIEHFTRSISAKADFGALMEIRAVVRDFQPDVVHLHSSKAGVLGRWGINGRKIPMFYTPHGYSFLMNDTGKLKRAIYKGIEKVCAIRPCVTISCGLGEHHETLGLTRWAQYINNGIDRAEVDSIVQTLSRGDGPFTVCTMGRIAQQKGPELFDAIARQMPGVNFVWIGDGELRDCLTAPNIRVTGWLSRAEALKEAVNGDVYLMTSRWEGLPIALLEAMYLGKHCVVCDIPGVNDVITDGINGYLCGETADYVRAISACRDNPDFQRTENARRDILETYNLDVMTRSYQAIYEEALRNRKIT